MSRAIAQNESPELTLVRVDEIKPSDYQSRKHFDQKDLEDLAASIDANGLIQPISLRKLSVPKDGKTHELVAGERRWRAHKLLGKEFISALVKDYSDREAATIVVVENLQRKDLTCIEEAAALQKFMLESKDEDGKKITLTPEQVGKAIGKSRAFVANSVRLLSLPEEVKAMLERRDLDAWHARTLQAIKDPVKLVDLAKKAVEKGWSVSELKTHVEKVLGKEKPADPKATPEEKAPSRLPIPSGYILIKCAEDDDLEATVESLKEADFELWQGEDISAELKKVTTPVKPQKPVLKIERKKQTSKDASSEE